MSPNIVLSIVWERIRAHPEVGSRERRRQGSGARLDGLDVIAETLGVRRPDTSLDAVIGLGANLGDGRATFVATLAELAAFGRVTAVSALYQTLPVGGPPQPDFLNAAVRLQCAAEPEALLEQLLGIERGFGRVRVERWGPRTIDLDILWIKGVRHESPTLRVPHPRLGERGFALWPLLDVAPEASDPDTGVAYRALAEKVGSSGLRRLELDWGEGPAPRGSSEA